MQKFQLINLPKIEDVRGNLSIIEEDQHIPFKIQRTYWIYDVPGGEIRGGLAYRETQEFIVALSGSFDLILHDGKREHKLSLNRSYFGVYVPAMIWRKLENFSTNSLALIMASTGYRDQDYIRNFKEYIQFAGKISGMESRIRSCNPLKKIDNEDY